MLTPEQIAFRNAALLSNLRQRWTRLHNMPDEDLIAYYDEFALSDMWGDNDERFLEFIDSLL